jgi:hypothetical protein
MKKLLIPILLMLLIISACATATPQTTPTAVPATSTSVPPTQTPLPTDTSVPTVEATQSNEVVTSNVSFANQVLPVLQIYCVECHGGARTREGLNLASYDGLMFGSFNGAVLIPNNANESLLVQLIQQGEMPERGPAPSSAELQAIIDWINQGAINN